MIAADARERAATAVKIAENNLSVVKTEGIESEALKGVAG